MKWIAFALAACLLLAACSDEDSARRILVEQGYTAITMLGSPWFAGCTNDDFYQDEFRATNPAGRATHGVVCSGIGLGKATTIHLYSDDR